MTVFQLQQGRTLLLISVPHVGTEIPSADIAEPHCSRVR